MSFIFVSFVGFFFALYQCFLWFLQDGMMQTTSQAVKDLSCFFLIMPSKKTLVFFVLFPQSCLLSLL